MVQATRKCSIDGCEKPASKRGWCGQHYYRWKTYGDPHKFKSIRAKTSEESFALRTEWQGDCLVWTGHKIPLGYGHIVHNGRAMRVHRYSWIRTYGEIPEGMEIDHICHNRSCVNPKHLRLATRSQNNAYRSFANSNSSSGVRNVYPARNKWAVIVGKKKKSHHFGTYETIEEARKVAEQARIDLFGKFAGEG